MKRVRSAVFISGRGSNLHALLKASQDPAFPAQVVLVFSNVPDAPGLEVARRAGVETLAVDHRPFKGDRPAHEAQVNAALRARAIELVALAGYMRILSPSMIRAWAGRMVNIHPSLLPKYPGLHTHARALAAGDAEAGCTVHLVTEGVDEGPILGQTRVPILPSDDEDALAARVLEAEHELFPRCLAALATSLRAAPPAS